LIGTPETAIRVRASQWIADGNFIVMEQNRIDLGNADGGGVYTIPSVRSVAVFRACRVCHRVRGGEYCFMPGCERCAGSQLSAHPKLGAATLAGFDVRSSGITLATSMIERRMQT
jgi:hypothetical protein